jgi:hypothetical protein
MDRRDLEQIDTFLGMVGKATLFDYYGLQTKAPAAELEAAIKKRRSWAQGQQANPKYRNEALWLIKNNALVRRVMVEQRSAYVDELGSRSESKNLEVLTLFIKGTLAGGMLTPDAERAIQQQGRAMGLDDASVRSRIDSLLRETGASRQSSEATQDAPTQQAFLDFYAILDVDHSATLDEIEASHRAKYRWARTLKDKDRVTELYGQLDEAWRVLKDPMRRAAYDAQYSARKAGKQVAGNTTDDIIGFLPSPGGQPPKPAPPKPPPVSRPAAPPRARPTPPVAPPPKKRKPSPPPPPQVKSPGLRLTGEGTSSPRKDREPPSPPPAVKGRTIGLGGARRGRSDSPRLAIASPEVLALKVGSGPQSHTVVVKNAGTGQMPGRISSDRDWLELSTTRLDAAAAHQEIGITVFPSRMRRPRGVALVTIVADHGERKAITINVERRSAMVPVLAIGGLLALSAALGGAWFAGFFDGDETPASRGSLLIEVDPTSESVLIDGEAVGSGPRIELTEGFPIGRKMTLTTHLSGFDVDQREIIVPRGESLTVPIRLELADPLSSKPGSGMKRAPRVDIEAFAQALKPRQPEIEGCLDGSVTSGTAAFAAVDIYWGSTGNLIYLDLVDTNLDAQATEECLRRELRATQLPLLDGDYALVEAHRFEVQVPPE